MYGSIRKNYSARRISVDNVEKEKRSFFGRKESKEMKSEIDDLQQTRYINVRDLMKKNSSEKTNSRIVETNQVSKNEFPIASVILTIVFTMMVMVFVSGIAGI